MYDTECVEILTCFYNGLSYAALVEENYKENFRGIINKLNSNKTLSDSDKEFLLTVKQDYIPVGLKVAITVLIGGN